MNKTNTALKDLKQIIHNVNLETCTAYTTRAALWRPVRMWTESLKEQEGALANMADEDGYTRLLIEGIIRMNYGLKATDSVSTVTSWAWIPALRNDTFATEAILRFLLKNKSFAELRPCVELGSDVAPQDPCLEVLAKVAKDILIQDLEKPYE